jgi:tRNA A-37 threonylcarbamoyl transferase component Bud32
MAERCPQCGEELTADAPDGLCPECLFQQGIVAQDRWPHQSVPFRSSPPVRPFTPPDPAELAVDFPSLDILQLLGQGGMGAVYKARQKKLDRLVALKILPLEAGRDPAFAERFAREARALARLNHPHIVGVHDFGEVHRLYYFVMEYVDGVNLRQLLETGQLSPAEALRIIPQLCDALQYAHEEGIVHRDIKPENILLDRRGRVKIADFGLAKLLGPAPSVYSRTGSQQGMGTPFYMAPEQMQKAHTVDHRADIYSLGVVFYEMLTGELPLGRFAPPSHKAAVDRRLDEIVFRALEKEPEQRYQHISDVKSAVQQVAGGGPSEPPTVQPVAAGQPPAEGPRLPVTVFGHLNGRRKGLLWLTGDALLLEYDAGVLAGWMGGSRYKEVRLPLKELDTVRLEKGWVQGHLKIRARRMTTLAGIPQATAGEVTLQVARADLAAADQLMAVVSRRLHGAPQTPPPMPPRAEPPMPPDVADVKRRLRGPSLGLAVTGLATCAFWCILLTVHAVEFGHHLARWEHLLLVLLELVVGAQGVLILVGALDLKRLANYPLGVLVGAVAMLPFSPAWVLGLPMGLWTLIELLRPDTRAAFGIRAPGDGPPRQPPRPDPRAKELLDRARRRVRWPALGLFVTGIVAYAFWGFMILVQVAIGMSERPPIHPDHIVILCLEAVALVAALAIILGSVCMKNLEAQPFPMVAAILAMLPWSPAVLIGLGLGVWALVTLWRPEVRAAFLQRRAEPVANGPAPGGPIRRRVYSLVGKLHSLLLYSRIKDEAGRVRGPLPTRDYQPGGRSEPPGP